MQEPGDGEAWPECSSSPPTFLVSVNRTPLALFSWGLLLPRRKLGDGEMCRGLELRRRCSHGKRAGGTGSVACLREKSECRHTHEEETHARGGDRGMGESIVVFHADPAAMLILQPAWRPPLCSRSLSPSVYCSHAARDSGRPQGMLALCRTPHLVGWRSATPRVCRIHWTTVPPPVV